MADAVLVATDAATILIAEDDRFDQLILKRAFRAARLGASVRFVEHGEELFGYLGGCGAPGSGTTAPLPAVVFLDLNMPVLDGWAALKRMRAEPGWRDLPIVVMSTLSEARRIAEVLALGADHYFTKPVRFDELVAEIRACAAPWLGNGRSGAPSGPGV